LASVVLSVIDSLQTGQIGTEHSGNKLITMQSSRVPLPFTHSLCSPF